MSTVHPRRWGVAWISRPRLAVKISHLSKINWVRDKAYKTGQTKICIFSQICLQIQFMVQIITFAKSLLLLLLLLLIIVILDCIEVASCAFTVSERDPCLWARRRRPRGCGRSRRRRCPPRWWPGGNCIKIGLPENRFSETISKRIGLPEDLFYYWESVFPEDLFLYNSSLEAIV